MLHGYLVGSVGKHFAEPVIVINCEWIEQHFLDLDKSAVVVANERPNLRIAKLQEVWAIVRDFRQAWHVLSLQIFVFERVLIPEESRMKCCMMSRIRSCMITCEQGVGMNVYVGKVWA